MVTGAFFVLAVPAPLCTVGTLPSMLSSAAYSLSIQRSQCARRNPSVATAPESVNCMYARAAGSKRGSVEIPASHASAVGFRLVNSGDPIAALEVFEHSLNNIAQNDIAIIK